MFVLDLLMFYIKRISRFSSLPFFSRNRNQGGFIDLSQESYHFRRNPVQFSKQLLNAFNVPATIQTNKQFSRRMLLSFRKQNKSAYLSHCPSVTIYQNKVILYQRHQQIYYIVLKIKFLYSDKIPALKPLLLHCIDYIIVINSKRKKGNKRVTLKLVVSYFVYILYVFFLYIQIFFYLSLRDVVICGQVCHSWMLMTQTSLLWNGVSRH